MIQVYCLSVFLCVFGALVLLYSGEEQSDVFASAGFKLGIALAQAAAALLLLASPYPSGKAVPFFGDFFPMAATAFLAVTFFFESRKSGGAAEGKFAQFLEAHKRHFAIACAAVGALHFFVPQAAFF